jgi:hypothetical protein
MSELRIAPYFDTLFIAGAIAIDHAFKFIPVRIAKLPYPGIILLKIRIR